MAQKVELRKRGGGNFSGNDNLMLPVTHINFVLGLLDGNGKFNTSLFNSSMLNTKRMAGSVNAGTSFASIYSTVQAYNNNEAVLYPGTYLISNGKNTISASTDHVVYYNDDSKPSALTVDLEHGDHLFYVKYGSEFVWNDIATTVNPAQSAGISALSAPYNSILGKHVFADPSNIPNANVTSSVYGLLTGFRWNLTTQSDYNGAGYKVNKSSSIGGNVIADDANVLAIPSSALWTHGQGDIVLRIDDTGIGFTYFRMEQVMANPPAQPNVWQSTSYTNKHIWGIINNNYDIATTESAGLMSANDKVKLNGLFNYTHPTQTTIDVNATDDGINVIDRVQVNTLGHVTAVSTRNLSNATTSAAGVMSASDKTKLDSLSVHPTQTAIDVDATDDGQNVIDRIQVNSLGHVTSVTTRNLSSATTTAIGVTRLATTNEGLLANSSSIALTPVSGLSLLNYNQDVSYFTDLTSANAATLPDGATAIVVTGTITI